VDSLNPTLTWNNSTDKDGDVVTYDPAIYTDAALTNQIAKATGLPEDTSGSTSWIATPALVNHSTYYWKVVAKDTLGAQTVAIARPFTVNTGNAAPSNPVITLPEIGGQSATLSVNLEIQDSTDADHDELTYEFEVDTANTFDSPTKINSRAIKTGTGGSTHWSTGDLVENQHYWWRVKAHDGRADSAWVVGDFLVNTANDKPDTPTIKNPGNGAWSAVLKPTLEANPVTDPEGEVVRYQFEIYQSADLKLKVSEGISDNSTFVVPSLLKDKTTYYWRVRALDAQDAASDWSTTAVLYVSTGPYQVPTIALTEPATPIVPTLILPPPSVDRTTFVVRKQVTINWEGIDPNIEATVALYHDTQQTGFTGTMIVGGLHQKAGAQSGTYNWDVTDLPAGAYYLYATITDPGGMGKAYAPGAVVIQSLPQTGKIVITPTPTLTTILPTSESGGGTKFMVHLNAVPKADVIVPISSTNAREGKVAPESLTFTPENWAKDQVVTVAGVNDCAPDGNKAYQALSGKAVSIDPNIIDLSGLPVNLMNSDDGDVAGTTDNPAVHICNLVIVTERQVNATLWEYTLTPQLTNTGTTFSAVTAKLNPLLQPLQLIQGTVNFGKANPGETILGTNTITVQSRSKVSPTLFTKAAGFKWKVTVSP
jgi:hypothetical protein